MIKGMVITPVVLGRISIGETVEKGGKRLPKKSDEFHITSNVQVNGAWADHPLTTSIKTANAKLRSIPVRIMFDTPENNFRSGYAAFNEKGRQICASSGDGNAVRLDPQQGKQNLGCPSPEYCDFAKKNRCKPYARLLVSMESEFERDPLAGFAFRTTGYNSISALTARLNQYHALTGGKMAGMTCNLVLRAKSTAASMRQAIFYTDIEPRESLFSSVAEAKRYHADCHEKGINLAALDAMVLSGHAGEPYSEPEDEDEIISSEFYPDQNDGHFQDSGHQNHGGYPANNAGENHGQNYGNGNNQTHDDQQFDENEEPSQVLQEVLQRISMIQDISAINAGKIWIQNRKDFKSEFERNRALQAIHNHFLTLQKAA